jgi:YggT family protein
MKRVIKNTEISEGNRIFVLIRNIISTFAGIIESFLLVRILLRLFGANEQNVFVEFIYSVSAFFVRPFVNIFENIEISQGMILEINTIIAMIVYVLITAIILSIFSSLTTDKVTEEFIDLE